MLSGGDGAQPPLLKSLARVHLALLVFRLVAGQIRVEARKSDLHQRSGAIGPLEFAVEVLLHRCGRASCMLAGLQFNLTRQERIVVADTYITLRQPLEAKDTSWVRARDIRVDIDVQQASGAPVAHLDHGLQ